MPVSATDALTRDQIIDLMEIVREQITDIRKGNVTYGGPDANQGRIDELDGILDGLRALRSTAT